MKNSKLFRLIINKKALEFIERIPKEIKSKCKLIEIERDKIVTLKENNIEKIHINLQGTMRVRNEFENGFIYDFASIEEIAFIGAMEIMADKDIYSSTLRTTSKCILLELEKNDFISWINDNQKLTLEVLSFVSRSMYEQSLKVGEVLAYPAICNLTSYLIHIYESENDNEVILKKSREEIGSILGLSVRTINRNLKKLKEEDLISVNRKYISISKEQYNKLCNKLNSIK